MDTQVMRTPQGTPVLTENMANVQYAVQDIIDRNDALAGERHWFQRFCISISLSVIGEQRP